jgi:NAD-dependent dihydropyrimidine dehydrogenase PreA subunit
MTIININIPVRIIDSIKDYAKIIQDVVKMNISFDILKFSTTPKGVTLIMDIPGERLGQIKNLFKNEGIIVERKSTVFIDDDLCINCGACISLCQTGALHLKENDELEFTKEKCIGCLLCLDSCPRHAIKET